MIRYSSTPLSIDYTPSVRMLEEQSRQATPCSITLWALVGSTTIPLANHGFSLLTAGWLCLCVCFNRSDAVCEKFSVSIGFHSGSGASLNRSQVDQPSLLYCSLHINRLILCVTILPRLCVIILSYSSSSSSSYLGRLFRPVI